MTRRLGTATGQPLEAASGSVADDQREEAAAPYAGTPPSEPSAQPNDHGCRLDDLPATSADAAVRAGYDAAIAAYADPLPQPLLFRFGSEMNSNGDDGDYGYDPNDDSAQNFIAARQFARPSIVAELATGKVLASTG